MISRRAFLAGSGAVLLAAPLAAETRQTGRTPRVGFLAMGRHPSYPVFTQALRDLGYIDGRNIVLEPRFADVGKPEQFDALASDLVQRKTDVIVALTSPEIAAARRATATIPIVMVIGVDPVGQGFAHSLARPGGNVTGLAWDADPDFLGKNVELLKELVPTLDRKGALVDPALPNTSWEAVSRATRRIGVGLQRVEVRTPDELDQAFSVMKRDRIAGVIVLGGSMLFGGRVRIADLGLKHKLPVMSGYREAVEAGGLSSYGPRVADMWRQSATYVDKILRGARPANLPIEQPTKFEFVINLKTAKALGLTIPPSLLARADQVIE